MPPTYNRPDTGGSHLCNCPWCVGQIMDLRDRVGTATVLIQERKESIANLGERLGAAENHLATLREKRAKSEGRDEVEDTRARQLGKAGIGLGGGAAIWQLIQYIQQLIGG